MKKIALPGIFLFVIVCGIYFATNFSKARSEAKPKAFFPNFTPQKCSSLIFIDRQDTTKIVRKGSLWYVTPMPNVNKPASGALIRNVETIEYPVDTAEIHKAFETIKRITREDLVSEKFIHQEAFGVDTEAALYVECFNDSGASLGGIYVGKVGLIADSYFIRAKGSSDVYSVTGDIRFALFAAPEKWRSKLIFSFDKKTVCKMSIQSKDSGVIELVKTASSPDTAKKDSWDIVSPIHAKANANRVDFLLSRMEAQKTDAFEGNTSLSEKDLGFSKPSVAITVTFDNGKTDKLIIGGDKVAMKWVRTQNRPDLVFTIYQHNLDGYNPGLTALTDTTKVK